MTPMSGRSADPQGGDLVHVAHRHAPDLLAHHVGVDVEERGDLAAAGGEAGRVGQGAAQVSDADDGHRPVGVDAEGPVDLRDQEPGFVARTPGAERAEERQVLAHLGRVDPGQRGQLLGGDGRCAGPLELGQDALVDGQAQHRRFGDAPRRRRRRLRLLGRVRYSPPRGYRGGSRRHQTASYQARTTSSPAATFSQWAAEASPATTARCPLASTSRPNSPGSSSPKASTQRSRTPSGTKE